MARIHIAPPPSPAATSSREPSHVVVSPPNTQEPRRHIDVTPAANGPLALAYAHHAYYKQVKVLGTFESQADAPERILRPIDDYLQWLEFTAEMSADMANDGGKVKQALLYIIHKPNSRASQSVRALRLYNIWNGERKGKRWTGTIHSIVPDEWPESLQASQGVSLEEITQGRYLEAVPPREVIDLTNDD